MEWRVLESPASAPTFLTSDRPVIRTTSLHGRGAHIAFPLTPRLLFIATPDTDILTAILKSDQAKLVKNFNCQIVEGAQCFVYGCDDTQSRFVQNRFGLKPQVRLTDEILRKIPDESADAPSSEG